MISSLIRAEADGRRLSREEILGFCSLLLLAGHETTANLIGNMIFSLLQNPQEFEKLKKGGSSDLISAAIEETLRYQGSVQAFPRLTTQDVTIAGQKIPAEQDIFVMIGSANHDESVFPDPEKFDISRKPHGHPHVAFGYGIHFCLGAPLARLEAKVALKTILDRLRNLEIDERKKADIKPIPSFIFHGVSHLPLRFTAGKLVTKTKQGEEKGSIHDSVT